MRGSISEENYNQQRLRQMEVKTDKKLSQAKILTNNIFQLHARWILLFF